MKTRMWTSQLLGIVVRGFSGVPEDEAFAALDHFPKVKEKLYAARDQVGTQRGVRLDIPSAKYKKLVVVSIHEKRSGGEVIGYDHSAVVKNARFIVQKGGQAKIGSGAANKFPMSFVGGTLSDEKAEPKGVPVYYDPRNVHLYVDARDGRPLKGAAKVNHIAKRGGDFFLPEIRTIYIWAEGPDYYKAGEAPEPPEGMESKVAMPSAEGEFMSAEEPCCDSCAEGLPCESCGCDESMEDVGNPIDYLDELEKRYREADVSGSISARDMNLQEWLDTQAALYEMDKLSKGVSYIDRIEDNRADMAKQENALAKAAAALGEAVNAITGAPDLDESLTKVLRDVSSAQKLARREQFSRAEDALKSAVKVASALLKEEAFRDAALLAREEARHGTSMPSWSSASVTEARGGVSFWGAADADSAIGEAILKLHTLKADFDRMHEIPNSLLPFYKQVMKTIFAAVKAREEAYQLRMMARKVAG